MIDKQLTQREKIAARRSALPETHKLSPKYDPKAFAQAREQAEKPAAGAEPQSAPTKGKDDK